MSTRPLNVRDIVRDKILVSRESAHLLEDGLRELLAVQTLSNVSPHPDVVVDFRGIEGIAPSFLDELITIFETQVKALESAHGRAMVVANPPMRMSLKFEAIARGHQLRIEPQPDGSWRLSSATATPSTEGRPT